MSEHWDKIKKEFKELNLWDDESILVEEVREDVPERCIAERERRKQRNLDNEEATHAGLQAVYDMYQDTGGEA